MSTDIYKSGFFIGILIDEHYGHMGSASPNRFVCSPVTVAIWAIIHLSTAPTARDPCLAI